jgi:hypothetical protein
MPLLSGRQIKWFHLCGFACLSAAGIYVSLVRWPYPKIKDLLSVIVTPAFAAMMVIAWISIHNDWSKERHDRAMKIPLIAAAVLVSLFWLVNYILLRQAAQLGSATHR